MFIDREPQRTRHSFRSVMFRAPLRMTKSILILRPLEWKIDPQ